jgi:hypothetical protein
VFLHEADGSIREVPYRSIDRELRGKNRANDSKESGSYKAQLSAPRLIRLKDAPRYLGRDLNRFNAEVRPQLTEIPIGKQGRAFDRLVSDAWADQYRARNGRPGKQKGAIKPGHKKVAGLINRQGIWNIDKVVRGRRLCESTGESQIEGAEEYLARRIEEIRQAAIFGVRPKHTWRQAVTKYLEEVSEATLCEDARQLELLDSYIGDLPLEAVHMEALQQFLNERKHQGVRKEEVKVKDVSKRTKNCALQTVRRILNLAASELMDEYGMTWLAHAPKIKLLREDDKKEPYPLSWQEQISLFREPPPYLAKMALFKVNTGCRDQEVCNLRWEREVRVPELDTSIFIIPAHRVKNREDRLVVLNRVAKAVIEEMRGAHPDYVFFVPRQTSRQNVSEGLAQGS